jgi:Recombinase
MHCFECNQPADHNHHVVPRVLGGSKTVPLCETCHGKVHQLTFTNHRRLVREGLAKAKARGVKLGQQNRAILMRMARLAGERHRLEADTFVRSMLPALRDYQQQGLSLRAIAEDLNKKGTSTRQGGKWTATQLCRMLKYVPTPGTIPEI